MEGLHQCTRNHRNDMSLTLWINNILCNMGLSSNISSNLYCSLSYSLSYSLHKKSDICFNKYLLMILTIKLIIQKSSQISYKLIYLLRKRGITQSIRHIPKKIQENMKNLSMISICPSKFDIFFSTSPFFNRVKNQTYQTYHLDLIKVNWYVNPIGYLILP